MNRGQFQVANLAAEGDVVSRAPSMLVIAGRRGPAGRGPGRSVRCRR
jgi:hypothetical protein